MRVGVFECVCMYVFFACVCVCIVLESTMLCEPRAVVQFGNKKQFDRSVATCDCVCCVCICVTFVVVVDMLVRCYWCMDECIIYLSVI